MSEWWAKYEGQVLCAGLRFSETDWLPLRSTRGYKLATYRFNAAEPKGLVFVFHGMHCSSSDVVHIAQWFYREGYSTFAFDQEGHGNSEGRRGNVVSLHDYAEDCEKYIDKTRSYYSFGTPIFLAGESMGGAMCLLTALKRPEIVRGIMLFAPPLGVNPDLEPVLQKIVRFMACCCCGSCGLVNLDIRLASRNPLYADFHRENPEYYSGKVNARTSAAMLNGLEYIQKESVKIVTPFILFQGGQDKYTSAELAREFFRLAQSTDKEFVFYDDMHHAIFHEPEIEQIFKLCVQWCEKRLKL